MNIEGQTAIVTGGGSGLGEATARLLAACGAHVAVHDINGVAAVKVASAIGGSASVCDAADGAAVAAAVAAVTQTYGAARILVNCAGIAPAQRTVGRNGAMPLDNFKRVIDCNLIGSFNYIRTVAAAMLELDPVTPGGERGVLINTASVAAYDGQIGQAAYSASKGGIVSMTLPIARDLCSFGIRVMTIAPGIMDTPMLAAMPAEVQQQLAAQVPFPKRLGRPDEYAELVSHIITNSLLNGETIRLDGALRMAPK